jgi:FAD/FMN-containing dehydrogenase
MDTFDYLPDYEIGQYHGPAAHFGSGLETWDLFNYMFRHNITIVAGGHKSIGAGGGWMAAGGHGSLASFYGLGSDQVLELHVVTADGRYLVANPDQNKDLFFALRGGGPSTYGVVTSVIVKAYPPITTSVSFLEIACNPPPDTNTRARLAQITNATNFVNSTDRFWQALDIYFRFKPAIIDAGGVDWDYLYPLSPADSALHTAFSFRTRITHVNKTASEAAALLAPLYAAFTRAGFAFRLNRAELAPVAYVPTELQGPPSSLGLSTTRYRSRLLPRANWDDAGGRFNATFAAIRRAVEEGGYNFHGLSIGPTVERAGWPGADSGVNPAWRANVMHACFQTVEGQGWSRERSRLEAQRVGRYMDRLRDVSDGGGSYLNEGDPGEEGWQEAFFGGLYERLLGVKRERDPWEVFWAPTTVGSEEWEVVDESGRKEGVFPGSQDGRLCRVGSVAV